MGHESERAALVYLHSSAERQRALAGEVSRMATAELARSAMAEQSGTSTALRLTSANDLRPDRDSNAGPTA